jgi:hypothetical protein
MQKLLNKLCCKTCWLTRTTRTSLPVLLFIGQSFFIVDRLSLAKAWNEQDVLRTDTWYGVDQLPNRKTELWHLLYNNIYGGPYMQYTTIFVHARINILQYTTIFSQCTKTFLSTQQYFVRAQQYFSVHNNIFSVHNNIFSVHNNILSVHNNVFSQCTTMYFLSAQQYNVCSQCTYIFFDAPIFFSKCRYICWHFPTCIL